MDFVVVEFTVPEAWSEADAKLCTTDVAGLNECGSTGLGVRFEIDAYATPGSDLTIVLIVDGDRVTIGSIDADLIEQRTPDSVIAVEIIASTPAQALEAAARGESSATVTGLVERSP